MADSLLIRVLADPFPEPRSRSGGGKVYHDERADPWKRAVRRAARVALGLGQHEKPAGPHWPKGSAVLASWHFRIRPPKRGPPTPYPVAVSRNDLDNLIKGAKDALGPWLGRYPALAWHDDSQVACYGPTAKLWATDRSPPGLVLLLEDAPDPDEMEMLLP